jgi:hypothetical protein
MHDQRGKAQAGSMPNSSEDPILDVVADVVQKLQQHEAQPDAELTCNGLLELVGGHSHALALFIFGLLNLLPAPPGYNFMMSLIIIAIAVPMLRGRPIRLVSALGRAKLPMKLVMKMLSVLSRLAGWVARVSTPRLAVLTGPVATRLVALLTILFAIFMLPPLPAGNMVPSIGVVLMCIGLLNHDGLLVIAGVVAGFIGLAIIVFAVWLILVIGFAVEDALDGEAPTRGGG